MKHLVLALLLAMIAAKAMGSQSVYRCTGADGQVSFSDEPCEGDSERVRVRSPLIGGQFSTGGDARASTDKESGETTSEAAGDDETDAGTDPCFTYTSTEIRRLEIRGEVEPGMNREQVESAWGRPTDRYEAPVERWIYDNRYYGRTYSVTNVYFEDGCVTDVTVTKP